MKFYSIWIMSEKLLVKWTVIIQLVYADDIQVDEVEATGVQPGGVGLEQPAEPIRRVRKRLGQAREEQNQMEEPTAAQPIRRERRRLGRAREETQQEEEPVAKQSNDKDMRGLVRDREDEQQVEEPVPVQPIRREKRKLGRLAVGDTEPEEGASKKTKWVRWWFLGTNFFLSDNVNFLPIVIFYCSGWQALMLVVWYTLCKMKVLFEKYQQKNRSLMKN